MNPIVEEIANLIVNRVSEQVLLKVNDSLDAKIKSLIPAGADGTFSQTQEDVITTIARREAKAEIEDIDLDSKVEFSIEDIDLYSKVQEIVRDMQFTVDIR